MWRTLPVTVDEERRGDAGDASERLSVGLRGTTHRVGDVTLLEEGPDGLFASHVGGEAQDDHIVVEMTFVEAFQ